MTDARGPRHLTIAEERPAEFGAIRAVLEAAFPTPAEADLVERLRADGDLVLGLTGRVGSRVTAYLGFSAMRPSFAASGAILALAPLAVAPAFQRRGIGTALVRCGLHQLTAAGCGALFVLGDPAYYGRFGFTAAAAEGLVSPWPVPAFQGLWFHGFERPAHGRLDYAPAFDPFL